MRSSGDETVMKLRGKSQPIRALLVLRVEILQSLFQRKKFKTSLENVTGFMSLCSVSLLKQ